MTGPEPVDEGLARYRAASEANDINGLMATALALRLGPKVGPTPGVVRRALRKG